MRKLNFPFSLREVWLLVVVCSALATVIGAMASLNIALADIAPEFHATGKEMTWIIDAYTLALAAFLLPAGALGDKLGRRGILIGGLFVFAIASAIPPFIDTTELFIASRGLAGIAAAFIMPATLSLISSELDEKNRTLGISLWAAVAGAGAIAGFFITGGILAYFNWQAIFYIFAGVALLLAVISFTIGSSKDDDSPRFDYLGSLLSVSAIALFVFTLVEAPEKGWLTTQTIGCLIGSAVLAALFALSQLRLKYPLLNVRLFTNRAFGSGSFSICIQYFTSFGMFYLLLQILQNTFGYSPIKTATALTPMVVAVIFFSLLSNWFTKFLSFKTIMTLGMMIMGTGVILLATVDYSQYWKFAAMLFVMSVGLGIMTATSTSAIMANTPESNHGVGSAVNDTARELGAAIGIALAGSIAAAGYSKNIAATAGEVKQKLLAKADQLSQLGHAQHDQKLLAQADALRDQASQASQHIHNSFPEAKSVSDSLSQAQPDLGSYLLTQAQHAFQGPANQAALAVGIVVIVCGLLLAWWTPKSIGGQEPTVNQEPIGDQEPIGSPEALNQ